MFINRLPFLILIKLKEKDMNTDNIRPILNELVKDEGYNQLIAKKVNEKGELVDELVAKEDDFLYKTRKNFYTQINLILNNTWSQNNLNLLLQASYKLSTALQAGEMTGEFTTKLSKLQDALLSAASLQPSQKALFKQLMINQNVEFYERKENGDVVLDLKYDNPFSEDGTKSVFITIDKSGNFTVKEENENYINPIMTCKYDADKISVITVDKKDCGFKKEETMDITSFLSKLTRERQRVDIKEALTKKVKTGQRVFIEISPKDDPGWGLVVSDDKNYPFSLKDYPKFRFKIATDTFGPGIAFKVPQGQEERNIFISFNADPTSSESLLLRPQEVIRMAKAEFLDITTNQRQTKKEALQIKAEEDAKETHASIAEIMTHLRNVFGDDKIQIDQPMKDTRGEDVYKLTYRPTNKAPIEISITSNPKRTITITKEPEAAESLIINLSTQKVYYSVFKNEPHPDFDLKPDKGRTTGKVVEMWIQGKRKSLKKFL